MAHFCKVENGLIHSVIVVNNVDCGGGNFPDSEPIGQAFIASLGIEGDWLQCSYSGSFRSIYPGIGWSYDPVKDEFVAPPTDFGIDVIPPA
jgi:hypothetical protein